MCCRRIFHPEQQQAVCRGVWLALNLGFNLLTSYKVDYACWQMLSCSLSAWRAECARAYAQINTHRSAHLRTMKVIVIRMSFFREEGVSCCVLPVQLTSLNLFQDLSLLYWATVPNHLSLLIAETAVSLPSKRATTGKRQKSIFWKQKERGLKQKLWEWKRRRGCSKVEKKWAL